MTQAHVGSRRAGPRGRAARRPRADGLESAALEAQCRLFMAELLRAFVRGRSARRATEALMAFVDLSQRARAPWEKTIEQAVRSCDALIAERATASEVDKALFELGRAALRAMVEAISFDPLAAARSAARSDALHRAVLRFARACEREASREGWSYIGLLKERLAATAPSRSGSPAA